MPLDIVIGTQWGDEGKGRLVDLLSSQVDIVARYNGGDNAGHTVTVKDKIFKLHLLPSGIIHPHTRGILGNGMVINPSSFNNEVQMLKENGVDISPARLFISHAAHLITPAHLALDAAKENARKNKKLGTTLRGIGPAYTSKSSRDGLRVVELLDLSTFRKRLLKQIEDTNITLEKVYQFQPLDLNNTIDQYMQAAEYIIPYIQNTASYLYYALIDRKTILAEGAQGILLDIDHGTYPYVTSSTTTAVGALSGLGVGPKWVRKVIGVTKVFQTRVGEGPFPTELGEPVASVLRGSGVNPWDEYGTTTGRPRRVGWLDIPLLKYAVMTSGITELFLTKLDILSNLHQISLCVAYQASGETYAEPPLDFFLNKSITPIYKTFSGWLHDISTISSWEKLPQEAKLYVHEIKNHVLLPIKGISVGPERDQMILISNENR